MSPGLPRRVVVEARAKLNLGLAVGPRRPDGFHELATVFQSISLCDTLLAERRSRGFTLRVRHEDAAVRGRLSRSARARVPAGPGNLALVAARRFAQQAGLAGGARFTLIKRIPVRAGLGGGSADAAAALAAMAALHGVRPAPAARGALEAGLGSDVPFAALGGTVLGLGRGERLHPLAPLGACRALVAVPSWRVSTARAFGKIDRSKYGLTAWSTKLRFAQRLAHGRLTASLAMRLGNRFETVLGDRRSDFDSLCERLREAGVGEPRMTGSGSAVFGLLAPRVPAGKVIDRFVGNEALYVVRFTRSGVRLRRLP
ncbi:MAG: 4-(cytidine 5'-diphospho)-2-C-methyl-D-erythritol kinase [Candidatus Eisenbacteria bacterium]|nr:4-(cytidine 5'-diphospho)-2-C-methyl-D-erythritol kinase [Candidatus Eisenbacteria bacterium]